jgi:4-hydroxy-3-methylbut-2-enyl diphosphate reductase
VLDMLNAGNLDLMIVIGGYNSSNTLALARMCAPRVTTFYVDSPQCVTDSGIRHRAIGAAAESLTAGWLPAGNVRIGVTAGASTPDSVVGETIERILALRGRTAADLTQAAPIAEGSSTFAQATVDKQSYA